MINLISENNYIQVEFFGVITIQIITQIVNTMRDYKTLREGCKEKICNL